MARHFGIDFNAIRDRLSLGQQFALVMAVLCLTLVLAATLVTATLSRQQATSRVEAYMQTVANVMASRLDVYMEERFRDIRDLATLDALQNVWSADADTIRAVLSQVQDSFPAYTWIGFADADGTVLAATNGMLEGASVAERPWFQHGLIAPTVEDVHEAKLLAGLLGDSPAGEPFRFVDVAVPISGPDGQVIGVIGAHMSWTWSNEVRDTLLAALDPTAGTGLWILRSDGRVLLGPSYDSTPVDPALIATLQRGQSVTFVDHANGPAALTAIVPAATAADQSGLGWLVAARRPLSTAFADADRLTLTILAIGGGLAVLGIVVALALARRLTQPLRQLAEQVDRVGRDPHAANIEREGGSRDILMLSSSMRALIRRLGSAEESQFLAERTAESLQQRMDEKTRTLGEHINALQVLADTDPLTHLLNRRAFLVFAGDAMNYFRRYGRDIGILVIDIDFFKRVNDTYGHGAGDDVIETVGRIVQDEVRTTDKVARFGGEEFVVLLRETESNGALALAERIRTRVAGTAIAARDDHGDINVTISVGLAMAERGDRDIGDVIERADRALYEAKSAGRNRVVADPHLLAVAA
jgi:diguanylate cyclase (GGDEF)-like protein